MAGDCAVPEVVDRPVLGPEKPLDQIEGGDFHGNGIGGNVYYYFFYYVPLYPCRLAGDARLAPLSQSSPAPPPNGRGIKENN